MPWAGARLIPGSRIQFCDSVSGLEEACGDLLVCFQDWVRRFEGQEVLGKPADPRGHCAAPNTCVFVSVCACACMHFLFFTQEPQPSW